MLMINKKEKITKSDLNSLLLNNVKGIILVNGAIKF